jgi:microcystin-dependent protein
MSSTDISAVSVLVEATKQNVNIMSTRHDINLNAHYDMHLESELNNIDITAHNCVNIKTDIKSINMNAPNGQINAFSEKTITMTSSDGDVNLTSMAGSLTATSFKDVTIRSTEGNINILADADTIISSEEGNVIITPGPNKEVYVAGTLNASRICQGESGINQGFLLVPTGVVMPYAGGSAPAGWLMCDGSSYNTAMYSMLYSVIGNIYGGSNPTFNVPDLRGRVPIGGSSGVSGIANRAIGASGGEESHTLTINEMPSHAHTINIGDLQFNGARDLINPNTRSDGLRNTSSEGGGQPHNIMQPYLVVNYIIKY